MTASVLMEKLRDYGADLPGIRERFLNDDALYFNCYGQFLAEESFPALEAALAAEDGKASFALAHTLKGVAGNMGLTPIYQMLCHLVEPLRGFSAQNPVGVTADFPALRTEYAHILAELAKLTALAAD